MLPYSIILLFICGSLVAGEDYGFVYPNATSSADKDLVLELGQVIDVEWNSPFSAVKLAFIAEDGPVFQFFSQNNTGSSLTWAVNVNNSDSSQPYYYLYFENENDNSQHYYSALFRIDNPVNAESTATAAATVTITPSPTLQASKSTKGATTVIITKAITPSPTIASSLITTASASSTSTVGAAGASSTGNISQDSSSGLSQSAKIGIGIGVPLGVLLLVGLAVIAVWSSWRHSRAAKGDSETPGMHHGAGIDRYANPGMPSTIAAGYNGQHSAYDQHAEKLEKQGVHGYAPVPQPNEVSGVHELPQNTTEPQELDTNASKKLSDGLCALSRLQFITDKLSQETPADTTSTSPYLEQLAQLASPVPDFAATLITQAEQDANDDNVSFLRTPMSTFSGGPSESQGRRRSPYLSAADFDNPSVRDHAERESQRRMRRAVLQHRRYTPSQLHELDQSLGSTQGMPAAPTPGLATQHSRNSVGYQGWAPGTSDNEADELQSNLGSQMRLLIRQQSQLNQTIAARRIQEEAANAESALHRRPFISVASENWVQSHFDEDGSGEPTTTESSLRTTALLQSVRRHARFSTRSRNQLESYILERERNGQANEERERQSSTRQRRHGTTPSSNGQQELATDHDTTAQRIAMQRARLNIAIENHPNVSRWLEEAIKYLERLRFCDTYSERISSAAEGGFLRGEYLTNNHDDFILDTTTLSPPPESSWLKVGGVFSGSQHAAGSSLPTIHVTPRPSRRTGSAPQTPDASNPSILGGPLNADTARSSYNSTIRASATNDDTWPVKVTINSIDYATMTLSGTMEAFNVPRKLLPPQENSITTFLEGEIIDFNRYTLETKSFTADASVDSTYWRKLEPFKDLSDKEIVSNLVSIKWLREELGKKWILMRWKEKCFVTPSDEDSGLTISGFYYVSLRRSDGRIEGLYYDPKSTPYQYLSLMPEKRMFPAYEFR
ncbi:hypothetical protein MMC11_004400 [Xylographa trunciseda]|nr:hypothetical protein [Xylographa trunciseda]